MDTQASPLERPRTGRVIAGTSSAIAERVGIGRGWIRTLFVVTTFAGGLGVVVYALATIATRSQGAEHSPFQQWIIRFDTANSVAQKAGWWILTTLALAALATMSFLQGPFVLLSLIALAGWLMIRSTPPSTIQTTSSAT